MESPLSTSLSRYFEVAYSVRMHLRWQTVMRNHLCSRAHSRDCVPSLSEISHIFIPKVESANSTMRGKRTALKICNYFCSYEANCLGKNNEKSHTSRSWFFSSEPHRWISPSPQYSRQGNQWWIEYGWHWNPGQWGTRTDFVVCKQKQFPFSQTSLCSQALVCKKLYREMIQPRPHELYHNR